MFRICDNWPCDIRAPYFVTNVEYTEPLLGDGSIYTGLSNRWTTNRR